MMTIRSVVVAVIALGLSGAVSAVLAKPFDRLSDRALEGIFQRPAFQGEGPKVLIICGGRPYVGNELARKVIAAGFAVNVLNGVYLDGLSGTTIKLTPSDPVEPTALDGITPEFARLGFYDVVMISAIPEENQAKLFTSERVAALTKYVEDGGNVIFTVAAPKAVEDLLPVTLGKWVRKPDGVRATRPASRFFATMPESWRIYAPYRDCMLKEGAVCASTIRDGQGGTKGIYLAAAKRGKGHVVFLNAQFERLNVARQIYDWAYTPVLFSGLAAMTVPKADVDPARALASYPEGIRPTTLDRVVLDLAEPTFDLDESCGEVRVEGRSFVFSDGTRVCVGADAVDVTAPNGTHPYVRRLAFPAIGYPAKADKVDSLETAEAVGTKTEDRKGTETWTVAELAGGREATVSLVSTRGGALRWTFALGRLELDGRVYSGLGQKVFVERLPGHLLSSVTLDYGVDVKNRRFRRFACYQPPRGYCEYDLTGREKVDTKSWGFFSDGQPFGFLEGDEHVFVEFVSEAAPVRLGYVNDKESTVAAGKASFAFGRVNAPAETPRFWQMLGDARRNTDNDWIALYQFVRHYLRVKEGFPEIPSHPICGHSDTCTTNEVGQVLAFCRDSGFRVSGANFCPAPMESFEKPKALDYLSRIASYGLAARPWFPCCHSPDKTETVVEHPDWYLKDEKGEPTKYFGHFYVADMNCPEFMAWHKGVVDTMFAHGVRSVWYDMGGSASSGVDFYKPESRISFWAQKELFRHYYEKGGWTVTEGMNPLVIDGYIFRERVYKDPIGHEFAMIGAQVAWGGYLVDFFRLAMYDIFFPVEPDQVVFDHDTIPDGQRRVRAALAFVPAINRALDATGMPFIRETPFGTSWVGPKGGALFCFNGVRDLAVRLPEDCVWDALATSDGRIAELGGTAPSSVPPKSIVIFRKR